MQVAAITLRNDDGTGTVTASYPRDSGLVGYTYKIATSPCSFSLEHDTQIITAGAARQFPDEPAVAHAQLADATLTPDTSVWDAMTQMQGFVGESIPVLDAGQLVGALSEGEIVGAYLDIVEGTRQEENAAE